MVPALLLWLAVHASADPAVFKIAAADGRLNTGLFVRRGETISIEASGRWTMWGGHFGLSNAFGHRFRVGQYGWGQLMARVGAGAELAVGTRLTWTSAVAGLLVLYPNTGEYGVRDGQGELTVRVTGGRPIEEEIVSYGPDVIRITVPADSDGVVTDVVVDSRQPVQIDAFGEWRMHETGPPLPPEGDLTRLLSNGIPWGRLVAQLGGPSFAVGQSYPVGQSALLRPELGGVLHLRANVGEYAGHRREGALLVTIRGVRRGTPDELVAADRAAQDYERSRAFLRYHQYRLRLRLPEVRCDAALMRAAQAHAEYLARTGAVGHEETPGEPGFTGATPAERAEAAGLDGELAAEAVHGYTDGVEAVDGLWRTVYHRLGFLDARATRVGVGIASGRRPACVVLTGVPTQADKSDPPPAAVMFPKDQQTGVPVAWNGIEQPSPFAEPPAGPVGFPLSLTLTDGEVDGPVSADLRDARGNPVPAMVISPQNDPHRLLRATVAVVPTAPLQPLTSYGCRVRIGHQTYTWSFTTGTGGSPILPPVTLGAPANPPIDLGR